MNIIIIICMIGYAVISFKMMKKRVKCKYCQAYHDCKKFF